MKKAQITSMITLLLLSIGIIANATMASMKSQLICFIEFVRDLSVFYSGNVAAKL